MYIDLMKTLRKIEKLLPENQVQDTVQLEKAYALTLCLRSQLIAVRYDMEQFGTAAITPAIEPVEQAPQTEKKMIPIMTPPKVPWRKIPRLEKGVVICTRFI